MAHFIGYVRGDKGPVSRLGSKKRGLTVTAKGWHGRVVTYVSYDPATDTDKFSVWFEHEDGKVTPLWAATFDDPKANQREDERIQVLRALLPAE